ncbi:bifunctional riboflavin kinase/FAD synthetase [Hippea jasoniae]|uniref:bifunctional riboflavin kinase/FAD synthetase n=1 Tax=Hippea jasoniae TaxID=944479 RepID=UPI000557C24C|nr:bifunctional riboflavin kinase/FAD synthetase [Hippea jasoniae]
MKIIRDVFKKCDIQPTAVALGNFDGIHIGHRQLIEQTVRLAKRLSLTPALFTFYPHPNRIIKNIDEPFLIQTFKEKAKIIENLGVDVIICARFKKEFADLKPEEFVRDILLENFNAHAICVGHNYTFGKNGAGNPKTLKQLSFKYNFELLVIPPVKIDGVVVSSTKIREFLRNGNIKEANLFLGRNYTISGVVKKGDQRGSILGFPTANIYPKNEILLRSGVYAAYVWIDSKRFNAAVNVGTNPTFKGNIKHIEAFILNFNGNLYGKKITIEFIDFIRDEKKFKKIDDLVGQIEKDIKTVKAILEV